jgi:site-specific DNA-methyltransferase (adenine-specific)
MKPYYEHGGVTIYHGDCREVLAQMGPESVHAIVTDPPYGYGFMGKDWDHGIPGVHFWQEAIRVLKPGAHLLAFGGTRTHHRLVCAIEDAGFEIRDEIQWLHGSGFPKSRDVSKAIDKAVGAEREVVGPQWQGWGTALKPACEPICLARKPLVGTVAENVLKHGTGAINVDSCRVGTDAGWSYPNGRGGSSWNGIDSLAKNLDKPMSATKGRWPANVIHDGSDEVLEAFARFGEKKSIRSDTPQPIKSSKGIKGGAFGNDAARRPEGHQTHAFYVRGGFTDFGTAARFFYTAKASKADRGTHTKPALPLFGVDEERVVNRHPTVKPTSLMRYLITLVLPPGGVVLDPFCGSGSTLVAARALGATAIGIDSDVESCHTAATRCGMTNSE